jgi:hypothetical protein
MQPLDPGAPEGTEDGSHIVQLGPQIWVHKGSDSSRASADVTVREP